LDCNAEKCFNFHLAGVLPATTPDVIAELKQKIEELSQFSSAARLKVSSNLRRTSTGVWFLDWMVHCSPNPSSVNSKQPQAPG
jgi:hypothetical protein